jgi:hypothetical protein
MTLDSLFKRHSMTWRAISTRPYIQAFDNFQFVEFNKANTGGTEGERLGLADIARHFIGWHLTHEMKVQMRCMTWRAISTLIPQP